MHPEVALFAPLLAPAVLDDPERATLLLLPVAHHQDGVVHVLGALLAGIGLEDTRRVVPESWDDLEGDGDGAMAQQVVADLLLVALRGTAGEWNWGTDW